MSSRWTRPKHYWRIGSSSQKRVKRSDQRKKVQHFFKVECIVDWKQYVGARKQQEELFLVRWAGYDCSQDTWERAEGLREDGLGYMLDSFLGRSGPFDRLLEAAELLLSPPVFLN
jgi:hypothetical protein